MPCDMKGQEVGIGDIVIVRAVVTGVDDHDVYINLALETVEPVHPGDKKTPIILNTRQVELVEKCKSS